MYGVPFPLVSRGTIDAFFTPSSSITDMVILELSELNTPMLASSMANEVLLPTTRSLSFETKSLNGILNRGVYASS